MNRKGQAATEVVGTYGFMILALTIIIAGLAYFGVLDVTKLLPKKCLFPAGIACIDQKATPDSVSLVLMNGMGYDIYVTGMNLTKCSLTNPHMLEANKMFTYNLACTDLGEGRYKSVIHLTFQRKDTNLSQTRTGELITRIPSNGTYY
jgi:hypothetical protein